MQTHLSITFISTKEKKRYHQPPKKITTRKNKAVKQNEKIHRNVRKKFGSKKAEKTTGNTSNKKKKFNVLFITAKK
jgi:hypothetical protein